MLRSIPKLFSLTNSRGRSTKTRRHPSSFLNCTTSSVDMRGACALVLHTNVFASVVDRGVKSANHLVPTGKILVFNFQSRLLVKSTVKTDSRYLKVFRI